MVWRCRRRDAVGSTRDACAPNSIRFADFDCLGKRKVVLRCADTTMSTRPNESIRMLRRMLRLTQGELAAMIGASKDTVASWETGRNKLSAGMARRLAFATGV